MADFGGGFATSGNLAGYTAGGGATWSVLTGTWTMISGNYAYTSSQSNTTPPAIAVYDTGVTDFDAQVDFDSGQSGAPSFNGLGLYFRVKDANNWYRYVILDNNLSVDKCVSGTISNVWSYDGSQNSEWAYKIGLHLKVIGTNAQLFLRTRNTAADYWHDIAIASATLPAVDTTATKFGIGRAGQITGTQAGNWYQHWFTKVVPPVPTITSPSNNSTVNTDFPSLVTTVNAGTGDYAGTNFKIEYNIANNSSFTSAMSQTESNTAYRVSGSSSTTWGTELAQGTWYLRARQITSTGATSAWTSTVTFTVSHPPTVINMTPSGGQAVSYASMVRLSWQFSDTATNDSQTAYQVVVQRNDTGATIIDTGKTASINQYYDLSITTTYKDVVLRWTVAVWDEGDKTSGLMPYQLFTPSSSASLVVNSPSGNVSTSQPTVTWTYTPAPSDYQTAFQVTVNETTGGINNRVFTGPVYTSTNTSYTIEQPTIQNAKTYRIDVAVTSSKNMTVTASTTVTGSYVAPAQTTFSVDASSYPVYGYVYLSWSPNPDSQFYSWRVYRRSITLGESWTMIKEIKYAATNSYRDYLAPAQNTVEYYVVQAVTRFNGVVESTVSGTVSVSLPSGGYWLVDPNDPDNYSVPLTNVTSDDYSTVTEQADYHIVGRGRHVDEGDTIGRSGSLTAKLRDNLAGTARDKKLKLEALKNRKTPVYLRNPFGDTIYISLGDLSVSRIAGVGTSEFVDVTIPYLEVF